MSDNSRYASMQLLSLKIRSLIADKEMVTAQANLDLVRAGEWRCDYSAWHGSITEEIKPIMDELERFTKEGHNGPCSCQLCQSYGD